MYGFHSVHSFKREDEKPKRGKNINFSNFDKSLRREKACLKCNTFDNQLSNGFKYRQVAVVVYHFQFKLDTFQTKSITLYSYGVFQFRLKSIRFKLKSL